jgi:hypothetical protein
MPTRSDQDQSRLHVPPGQVRDGILLLALGLLFAGWLGGGGAGVPATVGVAIAAWGLVLVAQVVWLRSRRRT